MKNKLNILLMIIILVLTSITSCSVQDFESEVNTTSTIELNTIPEFSDLPYVALNDNEPYFDNLDITTTPFENYSDLDNLGRCGVAFANICTDLMPTEERKSISQVKPTGWQSVKYDFVDGKSLYNRCHLIGFQLAGENANEKNLITGTRYLNVKGMLPFENMVADYVKETNNHVLYRVTPIFDGDNLVASGVQMEAMSVEDNGESICFNIFCYNNQPGVIIDYKTGESTLANGADNQEDFVDNQEYILNTSSKKFHYPTCSTIDKIKDLNKENYFGTRQVLIEQGYEPCGICKP